MSKALKKDMNVAIAEAESFGLYFNQRMLYKATYRACDTIKALLSR